MERKVEVIEVKQQIKKLNVCAYARVSTDKEEQFHSLQAQEDYYKNLINENHKWNFVEVYSDKAMTGTKDTRQNFQRMLQDCRDGKIDLIVSKSISRFARNTITLLNTIHELKSLGVDVYFEEQNIHTMNSDGELMLTILAGYAQEESYSVSENVKWKVRKDFAQGIYPQMTLFGYTNDGHGNMSINEEEAEIIRYIFDLYLEGYGYIKISQAVKELNSPAARRLKFTRTTIAEIVHNEKYAGDRLLQKTYSSDHITKKQRRNKGELPKFFAENTHDAIIDKETYEKVQQENTRRIKKYYHPKAV